MWRSAWGSTPDILAAPRRTAGGLASAPLIWRAEPHEAAAVARLLTAFRDHLGLAWPPDDAFVAGVERLIAGPDAAYLLAAPAPGAPAAGVAQVRFRYGLWWAADDCLLEDLFVDAGARGHGLGRELLAGVVELARERGCRRVELDVNEANAPALALYRSFGFDPQDDRYGGRNLFARLHLDAPGAG
jgi:GNAT superfamily N-acetyltransferase